MSPRPRKATDEEVFAAAVRVMQRVGPAELTLAEIAREAGLTAGALVQRFGGKKELLRAMAAGLAGAADGMLAGLRAKSRTPLDTLRAYARCHAQLAPSPEALARNLAYLHLDLTDPELHASLLAQAKATRRSLAALVREAAEAKELPGGTDAAALARAVEVTLNGSLMSWAVHREGSAERFLLADLDALLARAGARPGARRPRQRPRGRR